MQIQPTQYRDVALRSTLRHRSADLRSHTSLCTDATILAAHPADVIFTIFSLVYTSFI
jgi:hypothetical protein